MTAELPPGKAKGIRDAICAGNKIEAIKLYRAATGVDLKDSKDAVEKLAAELEAANPALFAKQRRRGSSPATLVFWGTLAALVAYLAAKWS